MIPDIGVMIGMYIITKMVVLIFDKTKSLAPRILSGVTIIAALISIADLFSKSASIPVH